MKKAWAAFAVTLVLVLPARIYAMFRLLDPETGFYSDGGGLIAIVSVVLVLGVVATVLLSPNKKMIPGAQYRPVRNVAAAVAAALTGVLALVQSVVGLTSHFGGDNFVLYIIFSACGLFAGAVILTAAYDFATGDGLLRRHPLLALIPALWGCVLLIFLFVTYASTVNVVENAYTTFTVVFLLLFLFTQAKLITGVESEKSARQIYASGLSAALLAFVSAVPGCILVFSGRNVVGSLPVGLQITAVVLGIYILTFLSAQRKASNEAEWIGVTGEIPTEELPLEERPIEPITAENPTETISAPSGAISDENLLECAAFLNSVYGGSEAFSESAASPFRYVPQGEAAD